MRFQEARSGRVECMLKLVPEAILVHLGMVLLNVSGKSDRHRCPESPGKPGNMLHGLDISCYFYSWMSMDKGHYDSQGGFSGLQVLSRVSWKTGDALEFLNFLKVFDSLFLLQKAGIVALLSFYEFLKRQAWRHFFLVNAK